MEGGLRRVLGRSLSRVDGICQSIRWKKGVKEESTVWGGHSLVTPRWQFPGVRIRPGQEVAEREPGGGVTAEAGRGREGRGELAGRGDWTGLRSGQTGHRGKPPQASTGHRAVPSCPCSFRPALAASSPTAGFL